MQRIRSACKYQWARACSGLGLPSLRLRLASRRRRGRGPVAVLMYHRVVPDPDDPRICSSPNIVVSARTFDRQMAWLSARMNPLPLDEAVSALRTGEPVPPGSVVITFDDGWADNADVAAPVLQRHGLPATIYLATDFIGRDRVFPLEHCLFLLEEAVRRGHSLRGVPSAIQNAASHPAARRRLALAQALQSLSRMERHTLRDSLQDELSAPPFPGDSNRFLTWADARALQRRGIGFGSHTATHPTLTDLAPHAVEHEFRHSKIELERQLDSPVRHLAYPGGAHNQACVNAAQNAGYESAVTTSAGLNDSRTDPFRLHRINICERRFLNPAGQYSPDLFASTLARLLP